MAYIVCKLNKSTIYRGLYTSDIFLKTEKLAALVYTIQLAD